MNHLSFQRRAGSALILALWALFLLSAAVFAWIKFIDNNIVIGNDAANGLDAKALAHSGIAVALNPGVTQQTAILQQQFGTQRGYRVQMTGEGGKLNLNWLLTPPDHPDPGKLAIFQRYLERRGLNLEQRAKLVDCALDWISPGNLHRLNGAQESADYHPPKRGYFISVEELAQVKNSGPLVSQPGWQNDFTIYSAGQVDLQSASQVVLEVLPGVGDANARRFLQLRRGPDGIDGTADDHAFKSLQEAVSYLGLYGQQAQQIAPYVYLENPLSMVHLISTGISGHTTRTVEVVAKKSGMQPTIYSWKEL